MITLSLVLGGTAFAAAATKHGDKKADTKLIKKLAPTLSVKHAKTASNATHATSADNATHASSADSATNATNATTAAAATGLPGPLASGQTEHGVYAVAGTKTGATDFVADGAVSFAIPLASAPTFHYVPSGTTTQCPGSFANPTAAAGQLCFYADFKTGATGFDTDTLTRFGVGFFPTGVATGGNYEMSGTWAVTAP